MPAPVFATVSESFQVPLGLPFQWSREAPGATAWAASGLPPGVVVDPDTGLISGTPTAEGVFPVLLTPSNGDGAGAPLLLSVTVAPLVAVAETVGVLVDFDLDSGRVTAPGVPAGDPVIFWGRTRDRLPVLVGFHRGGVLRDVSPSEIAVGIKEFEDGQLFSLTPDPADFLRVGFGSSTRYLITVVLTAAALRRLMADYGEDTVAGADMVGEIQVTVPEIVEAAGDPVVAVESFSLLTASNVSPSNHVWDFLLPVSAAGWYDLQVSTVTAGLSAAAFTVQVLLANGPGGLVVSAVEGSVAASQTNGSLYLVCVESGGGSIDYAAGNLRVGLRSYYTYYPGSGDPGPVAVASTATLSPVAADEYEAAAWVRTSRGFLFRSERDLIA